MNEYKFCKDCIYFEDGNTVHYDMCKHPAALDKVTGEQAFRCYQMRSNDLLCGIEGRFFVPSDLCPDKLFAQKESLLKLIEIEKKLEELKIILYISK